MKKYQKLMLVIALPMALFFLSERFFWWNYNWAVRLNTIIESYDNRTDNN